MDIDKNSRWGKWFYFWCNDRQRYRWFEKRFRYDDRPMESPNLCQMIRRAVIMPMFIIGAAATFVGTMLYFWVQAILELGWSAFVAPFIVLAIVGGIIFVVGFTILRIEQYQIRRREKMRENPDAYKPSVLTTYLRSLKEKTCPIIKIVDTKEQASA